MQIDVVGISRYELEIRSFFFVCLRILLLFTLSSIVLICTQRTNPKWWTVEVFKMAASITELPSRR